MVILFVIEFWSNIYTALGRVIYSYYGRYPDTNYSLPISPASLVVSLDICIKVALLSAGLLKYCWLPSEIDLLVYWSHRRFFYLKTYVVLIFPDYVENQNHMHQNIYNNIEFCSFRASLKTFSVERTHCWSISSSWLTALPTAHVDVAVCHSDDTPRTQWAPGKDRQKSCISQNVGVVCPHSQLLVNFSRLGRPGRSTCQTAFAWNLQIFDSRLIICSPSFIFTQARRLLNQFFWSDSSDLKLTASSHSFSGYHNW